MSPKKLSDDDRQEILNLYRDTDETSSTLAQRFGVTNSTISRIIKLSLSPSEYDDLVQQKRLGRANSRKKAQKKQTKKSADATVDEIILFPAPSIPPEAPSIPPEAPQKLVEISPLETSVSENNSLDKITEDTQLEDSNNEIVEEVIEDKVIENETVEEVIKDEAIEKEAVEEVIEDEVIEKEAVEEAIKDKFIENETVEEVIEDKFIENEAVEENIEDEIIEDLVIENQETITSDTSEESPPKIIQKPILKAKNTVNNSSETIENSTQKENNYDNDAHNLMEEDEEDFEEKHNLESVNTLKAMFGEDIDEDEDDEDFDDDDFGEEEEITSTINIKEVEVLPLSEAKFSHNCYLAIDRTAELMTRPLKEFAELGKIPLGENNQKTLPIFDNHRVAKRFCDRKGKVIKLPDTKLLQKTTSCLQSKGITRILMNGKVYECI